MSVHTVQGAGAGLQEATIRRIWHSEEQWLSFVDVCAVLTESHDARATFGVISSEHSQYKGLDAVKTGKSVLSQTNDLMTNASPDLLGEPDTASVQPNKKKSK